MPAVTGGIPSLDRTICWLNAAGNSDAPQTARIIERTNHSVVSDMQLRGVLMELPGMLLRSRICPILDISA